MVQIVQGKRGLGDLFGEGLGTGLSSSLQALAQNKMKQYADQHRRGCMLTGGDEWPFGSWCVDIGRLWFFEHG